MLYVNLRYLVVAFAVNILLRLVCRIVMNWSAWIWKNVYL